ADGTRRGRLVAFILLLSRPSRRPGGLRLWFCSWRAGAQHFRLRRGGGGGWGRLVGAAASPGPGFRTYTRRAARDESPTALLDRAANGLVQSRGNAHHEFRRPGVPRRRG